jgi:hypothetical protein
MKTGFSLCSFSHREKPAFITWEPCNENRFFPVWKNYTGKTLFSLVFGVANARLRCSIVSLYVNPDKYGHKIFLLMTLFILARSGFFFPQIFDVA